MDRDDVKGKIYLYVNGSEDMLDSIKVDEHLLWEEFPDEEDKNPISEDSVDIESRYK